MKGNDAVELVAGNWFAPVDPQVSLGGRPVVRLIVIVTGTGPWTAAATGGAKATGDGQAYFGKHLFILIYPDVRHLTRSPVWHSTVNAAGRWA